MQTSSTATATAVPSATPEPYMDPSLLPCDYSPSLSRREVHAARDCVQTFVEARLKTDLRVFKHTAPLALLADSGVNDDLDGSKSKSAVAFRVPNVDVPRGLGVDESKVAPGVHGFDAEVVQSLAKWKRLMLGRYDCEPGEGIFTEMHSIRKGYKGDVIHSNVCDQWDWEVAVTKEQRTRATLCAAAAKVYRIIKDAEAHVRAAFPALAKHAWALPEELHVITSQELCDRWPHLGVLERETEAVKKWGAIFVVGLGWPMKDGSPAQEVRAPDYDDWHLNGDIVVLHPLTKRRHELSSMGVRVDAPALAAQLKHRDMEYKAALPFHRAVADGRLPLSMGGGIGISRVMMLLLRTAHIGEVQVGVWADAHIRQALAAGCDIIPDRVFIS